MNGPWKHAFKVAGVYALCGLLWIVLSDRILASIVQDSTALTRFQTYKGWVFVLATATLVFFLTWRAVAESERLAETLRASEERFQLAMQGANDGLWDWNLTTDEIYYSPRWKSMLGYREEELENRLDTWTNLVHPDDRESTLQQVRDFRRGKAGRYETEFRMRHKDGHYLHVLSRAFLSKNARGEAVRIVGTHADISERKRTEEALRESERRFSTVFHSSPVGIVISRLSDGMFFDVNETFLSIYGYTREELIGHTSLELGQWVNPDERARMAGILKERGRVQNLEAKFRRKTGEVGDLLISAERIDLAGEECLLAMFSDITERKRVEKALSDTARSYRALVDNALVGVYRSDIEGRFLYVNDAMARIFECSSPGEMMQEDVLMRYRDPKDREELVDLLTKEGAVSNYELEVPTKTGRLIHILISATLQEGIISGMVLDMTERKKLEEQLRQAQKIEAIGLLAGGVAHDFNNILSAIIGYGHITLMKLGKDDPSRYYIEQILESSDRAAMLTQSLLAFSRKQAVNLAVIDINRVLREFEKFLHRLIREDISLETTCSDGGLFIMADRGQLEHVIMNLVTNARDAMPDGGKLLIETKTAFLDQDFIEVHGYGVKGEYAVISVSDTGTGMDDPTLSRIFEPFFTTKEQGKGTGLGLSMVYGTVKKHEGFVTVDSETDKGTTFTIYFPLVHPETVIDEVKTPALPAAQGGRETILVAEDDAVLRELSSTALSYFGYTVIDAVDGVDAVSKFKMYEDEISLVILDGIMPNMNGKEAFEEIKALRPGIKCIFLTGYAEDIFAKDAVPAGEAEFVLKPVSPSELVKKIREVLDRG